MIKKISDGYLTWLMEKVEATEEYTELFIALSNYEFTWTISEDRNRAVDGLKLRESYGYYTGIDEEPCTVLEVLLGLSVRVGEEILWDGETNYASLIFWKMIENLQLQNETSRNLDEEYIYDRLYIFLNREYGNDGDGALFKLSQKNPKSQKCWKNVELWYQCQYWLNENF